MVAIQQDARINDVLYYIHRDLSAPLTGAVLARVAAYSEQHFHRVFQRVTGESLHRYIRRIRLEQAANLLMFEPDSPVRDIALKSGYSSLASFTRIFGEQFGISPGRWRHQETPQMLPYNTDPEIAAGAKRIAGYPLPVPDLLELPDQPVAYIRHLGYGRSIKTAWQILQAWAVAEGRPFGPQIGLHHSNPALTPLDQCRYVACLGIDRPISRRGLVNSLVIPGGLHARFRFSGQYGDLLPWITRLQNEWLSHSGLKAGVTPAFAEYQRNQFIDAQEHFELCYYQPVSLY
ncbi:AraC family transcriptional regulator [Amphritea japonica]|uniref:AraC family transcriptional regulator n=1 Tax=Amphritea japonica ATCC BAA-1530 TaxID=1278309 RepID=A0A7R6PGR6_9GAMM|nr:helix-turn-helix domain-containing protein [Amphritea japonica]BBB26187.1 AraC family transcriptional regulator [Amphritea japonica ATCC BAA-1530]